MSRPLTFTEGAKISSTMMKPTISGSTKTIRLLRLFLLVCFALGFSSFARADVTIVVPPTFSSSNQAQPPDTTDYEGSFYDFSSTFPPANIAIGSFEFTIPTGYYVTGGTMSGTFGDVNYSTTALTDLYVFNGGIEVGECDSVTAPCAAGTVDGSLVSWSYTFDTTDLSSLASDFSSGSLDFTAVQNSFGSVIVGTPSLELELAPTPEPPTIFTMAGGLLAIGALLRRKVTSATE